LDIEKQLIARAVVHKELPEILEAGITSKFFTNELNRAVFTDLMRYDAEYGGAATVQVVLADHPTFSFPEKAEEPAEFLIDRMRTAHEQMVFKRAVTDMANLLAGKDHEAAKQVFRETGDVLDSLGLEGSVVLDIGKSVDAMRRRLEERANRGEGVSGVPTGLASLDKATDGFQPGQLVTLIAPPKTGKTMVGTNVALSAIKAGYSVWYWTFEQTPEEIQDRVHAYHTGVSMRRIRHGDLTGQDRKKIERSWAWMAREGTPSLHIVRGRMGETVRDLQASVRKFQPDLVVIDGGYFVTDEITGETLDWKAVTNVTQALKNMAGLRKVPVFVTTQARRQPQGSSLDMTSAGYSSGWEQYSDVMLGFQRVKNLDDTRKLAILASRICAPEEYLLTCDFDKGTLLERLNEDDVQAPRPGFLDDFDI
jgi:KaiC/GvpD/RAD55 family RecA-like ATPase